MACAGVATAKAKAAAAINLIIGVLPFLPSTAIHALLRLQPLTQINGAAPVLLLYVVAGG
jgi:hypothetical protein